MTQGVLKYEYEQSGGASGLTGLGGLPLYMDLAAAAGLRDSIRRHLHIREQGWTDDQMVLALVLLNLAGGEAVQDLEKLEADEGFCRILRGVGLQGLPRSERRRLELRWRKEQRRSIPSASSVFRFLSKFHDPEQEKSREAGKAFIPEANEHLRGLGLVNSDLLSFVQSCHPETEATLDMDATLIETTKANALFGYKGYRAYQPLNTWWAEQEMVVHTELRDGNVPAGHQQRRVLEEALELLPDGVERVFLRSDSAGYQWDLLLYCARGESERFGRIDLAVAADVSQELKAVIARVPESEWRTLRRRDGLVATKQEWAEVCFVPERLGQVRNAPDFRYVVIREALQQQVLPGAEPFQRELPFPTMEMARAEYKLSAIVTTLDWDGEKLIHWHRERCGKSEEAHAVMKSDLAGGQLPSGDFGENAAWWWIVQLTLNLNAAMKMLALEPGWTQKRMKAIRFHLINIPARVIKRSRRLWIRLRDAHPSYELIIQARARIAGLVAAPG